MTTICCERNSLVDLLSADELKTYNTTEYPFNLKIISIALLAKLKEDPDYEVWVPLVYYKLATHIKVPTDVSCFKPHKVFISNLGRVLSLRRKTPLLMSMCIDRGYWQISLDTDGLSRRSVVIHRALACCFIPIPEALGGSHPKDLQVNHVDGIKDKFALSNLEWITPKGNTQHALAMGLVKTPAGSDHHAIKPLKGIVASGPNKGYSFIVIGSKQLKELGFDKANLSRSIRLGNNNKHRNCLWSFATKEEIETLPIGTIEGIRPLLL